MLSNPLYLLQLLSCASTELNCFVLDECWSVRNKIIFKHFSFGQSVANDKMMILSLARICWLRGRQWGKAGRHRRVKLYLPSHLLQRDLLYQAGRDRPLNERKGKVADDRQQKFSILASSRFLAHVIDWVFWEAQKSMNWTEDCAKTPDGLLKTFPGPGNIS
jgi:hypothetical protein